MPHWRTQATCRHHNPDDWVLNPGRLTRANRDAIEICRDCPVRQPCLDEAHQLGDNGVIRGATPLRRSGRDLNREDRAHRNTLIRKERAAGTPVTRLAERYGLTASAVYTVLSQP